MDESQNPRELPGTTERARRWASTMAGFGTRVRLAHADSQARLDTGEAPGAEHVGAGRLSSARSTGSDAGWDRSARETTEDALLCTGATRARAAGDRPRPEEPDPWRTCFERDRDRILHSAQFRRLAGKTQVFIYPEDHQRTRLTHALEVSQVATGVARACRLNVALTEAIALGHDCGHGPGGHASEDALDPLVPGGFDHAPWGADVSLQPLNLCRETRDGIRNHSWSRPAPSTPEGEVVSWADRIAYVCHDWEDAVRAGVVRDSDLPADVRERCGPRRSQQLGAFIDALVDTTLRSGTVGMDTETADVLAAFRRSNYERVYLRDESLEQGAAVIAVLRALVHHYADRPGDIPSVRDANALQPANGEAARAAVAYVAGMTDRFAFHQAVTLLGWDRSKLPRGVDG
jgi:dGTPase